MHFAVNVKFFTAHTRFVRGFAVFAQITHKITSEIRERAPWQRDMFTPVVRQHQFTNPTTARPWRFNIHEQRSCHWSAAIWRRRCRTPCQGFPRNALGSSLIFMTPSAFGIVGFVLSRSVHQWDWEPISLRSVFTLTEKNSAGACLHLNGSERC